VSDFACVIPADVLLLKNALCILHSVNGLIIMTLILIINSDNKYSIICKAPHGRNLEGCTAVSVWWHIFILHCNSMMWLTAILHLCNNVLIFTIDTATVMLITLSLALDIVVCSRQASKLFISTDITHYYCTTSCNTRFMLVSQHPVCNVTYCSYSAAATERPQRSSAAMTCIICLHNKLHHSVSSHLFLLFCLN